MKTKRFKLREIEQSDIVNIHRGLSDLKLTKYYDVYFPTIEATQKQMDWYADLKKNNTGIWWGVYSKETNEFCGAGGFNNLDEKHKKAEIGFWLLPEYWGRGIMKEVMPKIFEEGFENLDLNRIEGYVLSQNDKCNKALEQINFNFEGKMRECEFKNGEFIDINIYSVIKKDWV